MPHTKLTRGNNPLTNVLSVSLKVAQRWIRTVNKTSRRTLSRHDTRRYTFADFRRPPPTRRLGPTRAESGWPGMKFVVCKSPLFCFVCDCVMPKAANSIAAGRRKCSVPTSESSGKIGFMSENRIMSCKRLKTETVEVRRNK